MLVSPEVGALIGAVMVWVFFWGVGDNFGTASGTASYLDVAAPLGIMAVAVALLMIGGEFDLSAGVMTGASGIMVGLMARSFMGDGASLWLAVPAAFVAAGCIGWFNGTLVNRTGLPSFIVTLGTFFVLRGVNLVFAKRLVDKVLVSGIDDADGFETFRQIFASVHRRQTFGARDPVFLTLVIAGAALLGYGLLEQSLVRRRDGGGRQERMVAAIGVVLTVIGFVLLHRTDGVGQNIVWTTVCGIGVVLVVAGIAGWRFETTVTTDGFSLGAARRDVIIGVGCTAIACVAAFVFDRHEPREILTWMPSWLRVVTAVAAVVVAMALSARHWLAAMRNQIGIQRTRAHTFVKMVLLTLIVGVIGMIGVLTFLQLTTEQAFRAILFVTFGAFGVLSLLRARGIAGRESTGGQLVAGLLTAAAVLVLAFVVRFDSNAVRFRTGLFSALILMAVIVVANTLVEVRQLKRTVSESGADTVGRRLSYAGVTLAAIGLGIRIFFTGAPFRISIFWWLLATALATFVLMRTKYGNWIFAVGGNRDAARSIGVPAARVKVALFMTTALAGCFVGMITALRLTSIQASQGIGEEFEYIIAAVVGGNLLTGGYGSAAGATIGAAIMAMSQIGIPYAQWNQDGRFVFLGVILLLAVLVNNAIRKKAQEAR
ncbi:MAG: hypothetical protein AB7Q42_06615 [Acidimicrobiia bacterium]